MIIPITLRNKQMTKLNESEKKIIEQCGTEPRFSSELIDEERPGQFNCKKCGQTLFSSDHKFGSGSGWPSFYDVINDGNIEEKKDESHGMIRTEVICSNCEAHLGHVFNDGPEEKTGLRYCINGIALKFEKE